MSRYFHKLLFFLGLTLLAACSGDGCGCEGFVQQPFPQDAYQHTTPGGGQVRLTQTGLSFVESNIPYLLQQFMPGGLKFCIPRDTSANPALCVADTCRDGQNGCQVDLTLDRATIQPVPSRKLNASITIGSVDEALSFDYKFGLTVRCEVKLHKKGQSDDTPAQVKALIPVELGVDTNSPLRELKIQVGDIALDLDDVDFKIRGRENFGDTVACGGASLVRGLFRGMIEEQIDTMLNNTTQSFADEFLCRKCGTGLPACPSSGVCRQGFCMDRATDVCLPNPLGVEGTLDFSQMLGDFSLDDDPRLALLAKAGDFASVDTGVSVGLRTGFTPIGNSTCVPIANHPRPTTSAINRSAALNENKHPTTGKPFMLGMGLHKDILEQMLWSSWASGAVCLAISTAQVEMLTTSAFQLFLPSIKDLSGNTERDVTIHIVPQNPPTMKLGKNTIEPAGNSYKITDSLFTVDWKDLDLHVYAYIQDRQTRLLTLRADLLLPIAIAPDGSGGITPVIENLKDAIQNVRPLRTELLAEDPQRLITLLPTLLDLALPGITEMITQTIQLPEFLGFRLQLAQSDITSIDNNTFVAIFANFTRNTSPLRIALQPVVAQTHIDAQRVNSDQFPTPRVQLDLFALEHGWRPAADNTVEYSYRVNNGLWSLYEKTSRLTIDSPLFALQGRHNIEIRARFAGDDTFTSAITTLTSVLIDFEAPTLDLERRGTTLHFIGHDSVDSTLQYRYRIVNPAHPDAPQLTWTQWSTTAQADVSAYQNQAENLSIEVEVRDQSGHTSFASHTLSTEKPASPTMSEKTENTETTPTTGGCNTTNSGSPAQFWPLLLGFLFFIGRKATRNPKNSSNKAVFLLAAITLLTTGCSGCQGELKQIKGPDTCTFDADCAAKCPSGETGICDGNTCKCTAYCPDGCSDNEFCCFTTNACKPIGNLCGEQSCPPGFEFREATIVPNRETCEIDSFKCECAPLQPLPLGAYGPFSDIDSNADQLAVSTYNRTYRDLMVGTVAKDDSITWYFVDGPPADGPVVGDPAGPRGGIKERGENVGTHTSIAVDSARNLHVLYRHEDNKSLKYARGTPDPNAPDHYLFETTELLADAALNAGFWTDLTVKDDTLHAVYTVRKGTATDWTSELHHIQFPTTAPLDQLAQYLASPNVIETATNCAPACTDKNIPGSTGLFTRLRPTDSGLLVTFYDHKAGRISYARFTDNKWSTPSRLATKTGPAAAALTTLDNNTEVLHLAFMDKTGLNYRKTQSGTPAQNLVIHDGTRNAAHGYYNGPIGQDITLELDKNNRITAIFQDAFDHKLYRATLENNVWTTTQLAPDPKSTTSHGFYAGMTRHGDQLVAIEFMINNQTKPNIAQAIIHRFP